MEPLANIERVDIREVWSDEARDFTPWLAEHITGLGAALGLDLESRGAEAPVGSFAVDVLAHDVGSDRPVVIENQLEATDHVHLGQLLTYAAGYEARVVIWIARYFRDEHRAALDMLNRLTGEDAEFFGVEVEIWRIAQSPPAPNFKVVAAPNEWSPRRAGGGPAGQTRRSEKDRRRNAFLQRLVDTLRKREFTNRRRTSSIAYTGFPSGVAGFHYFVYMRGNGQAKVGLDINLGDGAQNLAAFEQLGESGETIQAQLGELWWNPMENRQACQISDSHPTYSIDASQEDELHDWIVDRLLAFKTVFEPLLDGSPNAQYEPDDGE